MDAHDVIDDWRQTLCAEDQVVQRLRHGLSLHLHPNEVQRLGQNVVGRIHRVPLPRGHAFQKRDRGGVIGVAGQDRCQEDAGVDEDARPHGRSE